MTGPRDAFTRMASFFIMFKRSVFIRCVVSSVRAQCKLTTYIVQRTLQPQLQPMQAFAQAVSLLSVACKQRLTEGSIWLMIWTAYIRLFEDFLHSLQLANAHWCLFGMGL